MCRNRFQTALVFLMAVVCLTPASMAAREKVRPLVMQFSGMVAIGDAVQVAVFGTVGPPAFFANLHSVNSSDGTKFVNDSGEVLFFPGRMTITLRILGPVAPGGRSILPGKLDYDLMRGLQFQLQWKRGLKLRPVREFRQLSASESDFRDLENYGRPIDGWTYEIVLEDLQVPVTDHLILNLVTPQNRWIARLSARL